MQQQAQFEIRSYAVRMEILHCTAGKRVRLNPHAPGAAGGCCSCFLHARVTVRGTRLSTALPLCIFSLWAAAVCSCACWEAATSAWLAASPPSAPAFFLDFFEDFGCSSSGTADTETFGSSVSFLAFAFFAFFASVSGMAACKHVHETSLLHVRHPEFYNIAFSNTLRVAALFNSQTTHKCRSNGADLLQRGGVLFLLAHEIDDQLNMKNIHYSILIVST